MDKLFFLGFLGFNCGEVKPYSGIDKRKQEKGFEVSNGIPTLRGFAKISDLAKASKAKYTEYQRNISSEHVNEISTFLDECKTEAKFLPEIVLSINSPKQAILKKYTHKSFSRLNDTAKGAIDNLDCYILEIQPNSLSRVDGNHRLEAGKDKDYYVPFSIILWNVNQNNLENLLSMEIQNENTDSEAFLFYILNNTAKRLKAEENFKGMINSQSWTERELKLINKQLPILRHYHYQHKHDTNSLIDKKILYAPLSQICEALTEIDDPDLQIDHFNTIFMDTIKLVMQVKEFVYCRNNFLNIFFQLAFYTRYKSTSFEEAMQTLTFINDWLEKYKYAGSVFIQASNLFDVVSRYISTTPKTIFMAMQYKSEQIVMDYNEALQRAVRKVNSLSNNLTIEAYPIMTSKGKSINIPEDIYKKLDNCSIFIADITEANPNVMYELGIAYAKKKPIIMVRENRKTKKVPSDIINEYHYSFTGISELEEIFVQHIKEILNTDYGAVFSNN